MVGVSELDIFYLIFENPGGKQALFFCFCIDFDFFFLPPAFFLFRKIIWPLISFSCSISLCFDAVSLILWFHYKKGGRHPHTSLPITGADTPDG